MFNYIVEVKSIFNFKGGIYKFYHRSNFDSLDNYQNLLNEIYGRINKITFIKEITKIVN